MSLLTLCRVLCVCFPLNIQTIPNIFLPETLRQRLPGRVPSFETWSFTQRIQGRQGTSKWIQDSIICYHRGWRGLKCSKTCKLLPTSTLHELPNSYHFGYLASSYTETWCQGHGCGFRCALQSNVKEMCSLKKRDQLWAALLEWRYCIRLHLLFSTWHVIFRSSRFAQC